MQPSARSAGSPEGSGRPATVAAVPWSSPASLRQVALPAAALTLLFLVIWQWPVADPFAGASRYAPLHLGLETASIVIAILVFGVAWNSYSRERAGNVILLACVLLATGIIDFVHALSFAGMPDFITPSGAEKAINFWLVARLMVALALLAIALRPWKPLREPRVRWVILGALLAVVAVVLWAGLFEQGAWPRTFIGGQGLTPFKTAAEYVIIAILGAAALAFWRDARRGAPYEAARLFAAAWISILSELCFTLYSDVTDTFNLLGHAFKIAAYVYLYRAVFVASVHEPFERMRGAEAAVREAQAFGESVLESVASLVAVFDLDGRPVVFNRACRECTGYAIGDFAGRPFWDVLILPEERTAVQRVWSALTTTRPVSRFTSYWLARNGDRRLIAWSNSGLRDRDGKLAYVMSTGLDVTEREHAEDALRASEERYRSVVAALASGIVVQGVDGSIQACNTRAEEILGMTAAEMAGLTSEAFEDRAIHEDGTPFPAQAHPAMVTLATGRPSSDVVMGLRQPDASVRWISINAQPLRRPGEIAPYAVVTAFTDITEQRRLEGQLRQSARMEAIGQLAAGIAHDFNNMLTAIRGYAELLHNSLAADDLLRADADEILRAAGRASDLTHQLVAFSRRQVLRPQVLDVDEIVAGVVPMLRRLVGEDILVEARPGPSLGRILADPAQLEQVILNLAVNARDAMPAGGTLTIETANVTVDEAFARLHPDVHPGGYTMLTVSDTGSGMDDATLAHAFEPFFTTKPAGLGSGMGLATVDGIVRQSGGSITLYSVRGVGTTCKVYFPCVGAGDEVEAGRAGAPAATLTVSGSAVAASPSPGSGAAAQIAVLDRESAGSRACRSGTVLLVEDDQAVRNVARRVLEDEGYHVIAAGTGQEALALVSAPGDPPEIDVLVTDVVMPGMAGPELVQRVRERLPGLPVLYVSGFTERALVAHGVTADATAFLQKPFSGGLLLGAVATALDRAAGTEVAARVGASPDDDKVVNASAPAASE